MVSLARQLHWLFERARELCERKGPVLFLMPLGMEENALSHEALND